MLPPQEDISDIVSGLPPGGTTLGRLLGNDWGGLPVTELLLGLLPFDLLLLFPLET